MRLSYRGSRISWFLHWMAVFCFLCQFAWSDMWFADVTQEANITHAYSVGFFESEDHAHMSGGAVAEDFNGDGWTDIYVLKGGASPNLLYINQQDGTFADEAVERGVALSGIHMGACAADYDSDGDIDLFVSGATKPHFLFINNGDGFFSTEYGAFDVPVTNVTSPSWGDINNDGLLELALGSWKNPQSGIAGNDLQIYLNQGAGQLTHWLTLDGRWNFIPRFLDFDHDRRQDLLAVADHGQARWYRNFGNGRFLQTGSSDIDAAMGAAIGDVDNDGDLDMFMTSIFHINPLVNLPDYDGNRLLLNDGDGDFTDHTDESGVRDGGWGWGAIMADFDNDGDLDIYHVNGWAFGFSGQYIDTPSRLYENQGGAIFTDIANLSGDAGVTGQGRAAIPLDYDNDGDLDIFIVNNSIVQEDGEVVFRPASPALLRNDLANTNSHFIVELEAETPPHHRHGIGSRVYLSANGVEQMRELHASSGYLGHGPGRIAHFGVGDADIIDHVRAEWTNGDTTEAFNLLPGSNLVLNPPLTILDQRHYRPGETVLLDFPMGNEVRWTVNGVEYPDPVSVTLEESGKYRFRVEYASESGPRAESLLVSVAAEVVDKRSIARIWNEENLNAIRIDFPDPTKHARNLFASSVAMWDAWAAYDPVATGVVHNEEASASDVVAARREAISYAAYRVLASRYENSVNGSTTLISLNQRMLELGYDPSTVSTLGASPSALGNRVAEAVLTYTASDGWNDFNSFMGERYSPANEPLILDQSGTTMADPNRWQPLQFEVAQTQNEQEADLVQSILGPHWGGVRPFALESFTEGQLLHVDPGPPPSLGSETDAEYKQGNVVVIEHSKLLDTTSDILIDISPGSYGNNSLGMNDGVGHELNPVTQKPYAPNLVKHADFGRVLAEFWADGPDSETPPGHWNSIANQLHDHPDFERRFMGTGEEMDAMEWDVKLYLALNGALHDAAIVAWGCKRVYDCVRPISSIRYMGGMGQSSNPQGPAYHPEGLPLVPGLIEVVTDESSAPGERHAHLADHVGEISICSWSFGPAGELGRVDWMRAVDWMPYQRATFVTPAFPGYVSGHSTFSRAGAEILTQMTGSPFFPGGMGTYTAEAYEFLHFEPGPSSDVVLQWATYYDAADQAGISRLYGGIHVPADDGPGRIMGAIAGNSAWNLARRYYNSSIKDEPVSVVIDEVTSRYKVSLKWNAIRGAFYKIQATEDLSTQPFHDVSDWMQAGETIENFTFRPIDLEINREFYRILRSEVTPNFNPE